MVIPEGAQFARGPWEVDIEDQNKEFYEKRAEKDAAERVKREANTDSIIEDVLNSKRTGGGASSFVSDVEEDPQIRKFVENCMMGARWPAFPWGDDKPFDPVAAHEGY